MYLCKTKRTKSWAKATNKIFLRGKIDKIQVPT